MKYAVTVTVEAEPGGEFVRCGVAFDPPGVPMWVSAHACSYFMAALAAKNPAGYETTLEFLQQMAMTTRFHKRRVE